MTTKKPEFNRLQGRPALPLRQREDLRACCEPILKQQQPPRTRSS